MKAWNIHRGSVVQHTSAYLAKQRYNFVAIPVKWRWCTAAGKVMEVAATLWQLPHVMTMSPAVSLLQSSVWDQNRSQRSSHRVWTMGLCCAFTILSTFLLEWLHYVLRSLRKSACLSRPGL